MITRRHRVHDFNVRIVSKRAPKILITRDYGIRCDRLSAKRTVSLHQRSPSGGAGQDRTDDLGVRSASLYPTELQPRPGKSTTSVPLIRMASPKCGRQICKDQRRKSHRD
jgi:hypothetical protein